jgi:hypothetical protein
MIKILQTNGQLKLVDNEKKKQTIYQIPLNRINNKSSNPLCPEWIMHLSRKSFTKGDSKSCLYELAKIIEKNRPGVFDWNETFNSVEQSAYESAVFEEQNKKNEDEFGGLDLADLETDWDLMSDPDTLLAISEAVNENLIKHGLPFKN